MALKNICDIANMSISEKLEDNLVALFDWGFVDKGGYINVDLNQSGCYIDNRSILNKINDPRYSGVSVWEGVENWVYETGMSVGSGNSPLIYLDGVLDTGNIATINYKDGRVYTPTTVEEVKAQYSYKWVTFTSARKSRWVRRVQYYSQRKNDNHLPPEINMPLPCVTIDVPPIGRSKAYGLGAQSPRVYNNFVHFTIFAENASDAVKIADYIAMQESYAFLTFDPEEVIASGDYPLNFDGSLNSGKNYDELCNTYCWNQVKFNSAEGTYGDYIGENLYLASVLVETELISCHCGL